MKTSFTGLRLALIGPQAPPSGGMANQTAQLLRLLRESGASVELVATNLPSRPAWLARLRGLRALLRLPPYLWRLWRAGGRADLFHVMANSGWAWHLYAAPAIWIARLRGKGVLLNYRGGEAEAFLARRGWLVLASLNRAHALVVPSGFLVQVFARHAKAAQIVPNVVNLSSFVPTRHARTVPTVLVARHLEPLYDNATAIRALALLRQSHPQARLLVAGAGSELPALQSLAVQLDLRDAVQFIGPVDNAAMPFWYHQCDIVLNASLADNMPISVLEALACERPVVSTRVGGIPHLLQDGVNALLVRPGDASAMSSAIDALLRDPARAARMAAAGRQMVCQFDWPHVAPLLAAQYRRVLRRPRLDLYGKLAASLLFPLQEKFKRHDSLAVRQRMEGTQWWSRAEIEALQLARLRDLLRHAAAHVPYYRALCADLGFNPERVHDLRDLRCLPIVRKSDINGQREAFRSGLARDLKRCNTGGSSGEPLIFYLGRERISHDVAAKWRATRWWGVDVGAAEAVVWGSPIELGAQDRLRAVRDRLLRTRLLPAFEMGTARMDAYLAQLRRQRPAMLFGYPSALSRLARHARARRKRMDDLGIRVAFVTAERLYDEQRALISDVFGCAVANGYGGRDAGFIAHECPEGGLHITAEDVIVEIVDEHGRPQPAGATGMIVVTHLASRDFPFIRYATGDIGALDDRPCPCGRGLPLLRSVEGRSTDFLVAQDGTVMHGLALIYILRELPQILAFKIVQESLALTRVLLVCALTPDELLRQTIVKRFRARLGETVEIAIELVPEIAAEASGKHRYVVSKISPH